MTVIQILLPNKENPFRACPNDDSPLWKDFQFCPQCGARIEWIKVITDDLQEVIQRREDARQKRKEEEFRIYKRLSQKATIKSQNKNETITKEKEKENA